jgi:hypothetical protein
MRAVPPVVAGGFQDAVIAVNEVGITEVSAGTPAAWVGDPDVYAYEPRIEVLVSAATRKYAGAPAGRPVISSVVVEDESIPLSVQETPSWLCSTS